MYYFPPSLIFQQLFSACTYCHLMLNLLRDDNIKQQIFQISLLYCCLWVQMQQTSKYICSVLQKDLPPSRAPQEMITISLKDQLSITKLVLINCLYNQGILGRFEIKQAALFDEHSAAVWRVCWNVTGTILATSGDDGQVGVPENFPFLLFSPSF